uniref:Uncharacterized protein n=1 Tax=Plectus sambesii TaxID=2011161 RepID=A0A914VRL2_9BILA
MTTKWQRNNGNTGQQTLDLTGFGKVVNVEEDGGAVIESLYPRQDQIVVPSKTAQMYFRSRLNGGARLAVGDSVCYVANKSFVAQVVATTISGWGTVASVQRGHGFLARENCTTQIFFPGSAVTDDLWNFHNLTQSLRVGDQLQYNAWNQTEYLDRTSVSLKAETVSLPTMTDATDDEGRPDLGFVMHQTLRRLECVLYCKPRGAVLLHKDDVEEQLDCWPPQLGTRFIFESVAENDAQYHWRAIRAVPREFLLKRADVGRRSQQVDESIREGNGNVKIEEEDDDLPSMSNLVISISDNNNDRRVVEKSTAPKRASESANTFDSATPAELNRPQQRNSGGCTAAPVVICAGKRASCSPPEKATQTEYYPIQLRFINTIVNDPEILDIITKRYTQEFYELIQAQE